MTGDGAREDRQSTARVRNDEEGPVKLLVGDILHGRRDGSAIKGVREIAVSVAFLADHSDEKTAGFNAPRVVVHAGDGGITISQQAAARKQDCQFS
jgi:hypothetical protein